MRTAGSLEPQTDLNLKQWIKQGEIAGYRAETSVANELGAYLKNYRDEKGCW
jgi:hypothetical protein